MTTIRKWAISAILAGASFTAAGADQWCSGVLSSIYIDNQGNTFVFGPWRNDFTMVCNLQNPWNGIQPEICAYWYSLLAASKTHSKRVVIFYPNISATCSTLPTYGGSPAPGYVMQQDVP